ncbi:hypothetical protein [Microbacterium hominis]|uniref:Lipoprotein n=1 Tax=Microbacterium hominis TaxID=162426 RepID=A0A7D4U9I8_9MICO|nr:hypothetical protein [Microbacterium hominis]QKJ20766.1 hypothetical protein HQM25_16310 [Microbacterium hominis]
MVARGRAVAALSTAVQVAMLGALLVACDPAGPPSPSPDAVPAGLEVALVQLRGDVAARQAQVQVSNGSDEAVVIGDVRVQDERFDGEATRVVAGRTTTVPPGGRVEIRVQLPEMACAGDGTVDAAPVVLLDLGGDAGEPVRAAATDPLGFVGPLHERECRAQALGAAVDLAFTSFTTFATGSPGMLRLEMTPTGDSATEVTIVAVEGTNLLDFGDASVDGTFPIDADVTADGAAQGVDVPIVPFRCDPHAVQEDKRGTIFDVRVIVDGEPGEIELFVGDALRGRILTWVAQWCGFGT